MSFVSAYIPPIVPLSSLYATGGDTSNLTTASSSKLSIFANAESERALIFAQISGLQTTQNNALTRLLTLSEIAVVDASGAAVPDADRLGNLQGSQSYFGADANQTGSNTNFLFAANLIIGRNYGFILKARKNVDTETISPRQMAIGVQFI